MKSEPLIKGSKYGNPVSTPNFRPLNPWGRGFPKRPEPMDKSTWCVSVFDRNLGTRVMAGVVGPRDGPQMLCDAIKQQIELGRERNWADPQVVRVFDLTQPAPSRDAAPR